jgi:hypothetical protein
MARRFALALVGSLVVVTAFLAVGARAAVEARPKWEIDVLPVPFHFDRSEASRYEVVAVNIGGEPAGAGTKFELVLPADVVISEFLTENSIVTCSGAGSNEAVCELLPASSRWAARAGIVVDLAGHAASEVEVTARIFGGGAPTTERTVTNRITSTPTAFEIGEWRVFGSDNSGEAFHEAAGHPQLFNSLLTTPVVVSPGEEGVQGAEFAKNFVIDLPPGMFASPAAVAQCPIPTFFSSEEPQCPALSQIGNFSVSGQANVYAGETNYIGERNPIYNLTPESGFPAEIGFWDSGVGLGAVGQGRLVHTSQGYVVRVTVPNAAKGLFGPYYLQASFYGDPARMDGSPGVGQGFLTYPSHCSQEPLGTAIHFDSWSLPAPLGLEPNGEPDFETANFAESRWHSAVAEAPAVTGCEGLQFSGHISVKPDSQASDSSSGLAVNLSVPQETSAAGKSTPPLRDATVALPRGLVVNPSSASGLAGCTEAELNPGSVHPGGCPEASKIGTVTLRTPALEGTLQGSLFLGTPECGPCRDADAASGRLVHIYIEINDPKTGIVVKLPGTVAVDPSSGQLTATFTENPQLPFEEIELHVKSGPRAPLTTPTTCGEYTTTSDLMPWSAPQSGPDAKPQGRFSITSGPNGSGCASSESGLSNSPSFEAGTTVPLAASYSPFVLKVARENGSQRIASIDTTLPYGLVGKLAGIPYCSDQAIAAAAGKSGRAEQASPSCPMASEVGIVNVGAGSGAPFYVQGHAYLAGPYKGAPLSLEIITPAVAGPFDLGTVAVRTALFVNESTAQVRAVSDPIPSMLAGIPLDVRSIAVNMNRPQFILNPTSCNTMKVLGSTTSTVGQSASLQNRFQVGGCKGLEFKPTLKLAFTGQTKRTGFPAVKAVLTQPKGQNANLAGATVILPKGMLVANAHINNPCTRVQFNSGKLPGEGCPPKSVLGTAKVWTPLLEQPESGKVYFRSNGGERELPDLAVALQGQVPLQLLGFIDSVGKKNAEVRRVRSRFLNLPDAPVTRFELKLSGGKKGLLQNSKNLCKVSDKAKFLLTGQNAKVYDTEPKVQVSCGKGKGKKAGGKKHRHSHG